MIRNLLLVAGARPNFMKIAPLIRVLESRRDFRYQLLHTGQHYDSRMSDVFFSDLGIPPPAFHLNVGSGTHAQQTASIMTAFEPVLAETTPDCVVVVGDVNSTLACTIVAKKQHVAVAHVEAGLRSGDLAMPEEINRIVTDSISDYLFASEQSGVDNLLREGKVEASVHFVGQVMVDNLFYEVGRLDRDPAPAGSSEELKRGKERYGVVTLHRPSNVDDPGVLKRIMQALAEISGTLPLVFPAHPRTRARIEEFGTAVPEGLTIVEPLGYRDFLNLWRDASVVVTDSGGLQEETTALGVPCVTVRENTERPVTIELGTNVLVGSDPEKIVASAMAALGGAIEARRPPLWDGKAAERIVDVLGDLL